MRLCIKRIYCLGCQRLVKGHEHREEEDVQKTHILCSRCERPLYFWNGITWKYVRG